MIFSVSVNFKQVSGIRFYVISLVVKVDGMFYVIPLVDKSGWNVLRNPIG